MEGAVESTARGRTRGGTQVQCGGKTPLGGVERALVRQGGQAVPPALDGSHVQARGATSAVPVRRPSEQAVGGVNCWDAIGAMSTQCLSELERADERGRTTKHQAQELGQSGTHPEAYERSLHHCWASSGCCAVGRGWCRGGTKGGRKRQVGTQHSGPCGAGGGGWACTRGARGLADAIGAAREARGGS